MENYIKKYDLQDYYDDDFAHGWKHINNVFNNSVELADADKRVDRRVLLAAAALHDIGREAQIVDKSLDHARVGAAISKRLLKDRSDLNFIQRAKVVNAVKAHRKSGKVIAMSREAKLLRDADRMDAIGMRGYDRAVKFGERHGRPEFDENLMPHTGEDTAINHMIEVLIPLDSSKFSTPGAKSLADKHSLRMSERVSKTILDNTSKQEWLDIVAALPSSK